MSDPKTTLQGAGDHHQLLPAHHSDQSQKLTLDRLEEPGGESAFRQISERVKLETERCLSELERIRTEKEESSSRLQKAVREQAEAALAALRSSLGEQQESSSQGIAMKCERIEEALRRVEVLVGGEEFARRKQAVTQKVAETIRELNEKRQGDEQMLEDMAVDVQDQVQAVLLAIHRDLDSDARKQVEKVVGKMTELQRTLANVHHFVTAR